MASTSATTSSSIYITTAGEGFPQEPPDSSGTSHSHLTQQTSSGSVHQHVSPNAGRSNAARTIPHVSRVQPPSQPAPMQVNLGAALLRLARYYLQCDAIEEPINDSEDKRRLKILTISMALSDAKLHLGAGNREEDNERTNKESLYRCVTGKEIMEWVKHPPIGETEEDRMARARSKTATAAVSADLLEAAYCGGRAAHLMYQLMMYNMQSQGDKLKRGEAIVIKGIRDHAHEYMELLPSEEEVIAAESNEVDKHPAVGDTWLKGGAAMLRPHTRHATFRRGEIFSVTEEDFNKELGFLSSMRGQILQAFGPHIGGFLQGLRNANLDLPPHHPLAGKSIADPDFERKSRNALQEMPAELRRSKAISALEAVGFSSEDQQKLADVVISMILAEENAEAL